MLTFFGTDLRLSGEEWSEYRCTSTYWSRQTGAEAAEATDYAIELAANFDAVIHSLYVVEPTSVTLPSEAMRQEEIREEYVEWGEDITADAMANAEDHGLQSVTAVGEGPAHDEINRYATENDIDLVVMGTTGRSGLRERLLGSVTEKTARISDVPVLIVRDGQRS
jgi:nucleotide-binding universal stress UspA family protein